ncbi:FAD binding domain-containing protein [Amylocarpus encephaloides]|uniref:FAD binding domain-containing protein n=1 Tax=Amylocarpus encephaloides TaxID=45428 RepID=A0A9P7YQX3_9HELO|nr:FAD binding domain-containing protein [Amylocarpus encephaloides]
MSCIESPTRSVDVLVVGGGPVGLVTAIQLQHFSNSSSPYTTLILEKHPKSTQDSYGRAITLYPRTTEMLDQLSLADELAQKSFACRSTVSYDRNGKEVAGRGWSFMEQMGKDSWTQWDFALVLRQMYQEDVFRERLKSLGGNLETEKEVVRIDVDESVEIGGFRVRVVLIDGKTGAEEVIVCRYVIGADGGRSFVRRDLEIPFDGETTEDRWVRIDGVVETDMPKSRGYGAIESPTHGNVLWAALDHGATRIGFAFTKERREKYETFDEAAAVAEAIESVKPFKLSFKQIDWFTVYSVGQRVARNFYTKDCIFLAGDACHTHSSGAAQGMNAGIHDAVNLAWKLNMVLQKQASHSILSTYEDERRPNVQKLINYDKEISRLMTMQLPWNWKGDPKADPNEILGLVMAEASAFTSGLSISFNENLLNVRGSFSLGNLGPIAGCRGPDAKLFKPGSFEATRLHKELPSNSKFYVIVFTGDPDDTKSHLSTFFAAVKSSSVFQKKSLPIKWTTIAAKAGPSAYELLGVMPLGRIYYDVEETAHLRYGVDSKEGGVFVLRPDGWIGTAAPLKTETVKELETYLRNILILD